MVGRWEGGGTHTGPAFSGLVVGSLPEASGRKIHFSGTTVYRIENGVREEIGQEQALTPCSSSTGLHGVTSARAPAPSPVLVQVKARTFVFSRGRAFVEPRR